MLLISMPLSEEELEQDDEKFAAQVEDEELEESGMGIECGCCFVEHAFVSTDYIFIKMQTF